MKISTLMIMVTLSASCFATPVHTARDARVDIAIENANAAPVAPAAPDVAAMDTTRPQHWQHIALPKSRRLDRMAGRAEHLQT
ncbi:hypothetical protein [Paraburkholderia sp.]|uniref:hypothetical protein n=1 Tax=Paraburkholderia sp. TaxID=1926495 RepID=UPI0023A6E6F4|nr:hypothetical protein [Paraburkholderia sp.]MDE1184134.1 hypothetical protein [Paraburkholderia sp.]